MYQFSPPIIDRKIRFALVGCGRIAQNHFTAIKHHDAHAELVGVCDIDIEALNLAAKTTGAIPYPSLTEMLTKSNADAFVDTLTFLPGLTNGLQSLGNRFELIGAGSIEGICKSGNQIGIADS